MPAEESHQEFAEANAPRWIDDDEISDFDVIINHPKRQTLPGQRAWMQFRGVRRTIPVEEARRLAEIFQSTPIWDNEGHSHFPRHLYRERESEDGNFRCREASFEEIKTNVNTKPTKPKANHKESAMASPLNKKRKTSPPKTTSGAGKGKTLPLRPPQGTLRSIISYYLERLDEFEHRYGLEETQSTIDYRRTLDSIVTVPYSDKFPEELVDFAYWAYHHFIDSLKDMWEEILRLCMSEGKSTPGLPSMSPPTHPGSDPPASGPGTNNNGQPYGRAGKGHLSGWRSAFSGLEKGPDGNSSQHGTRSASGKSPRSPESSNCDDFSMLPDPTFINYTGTADKTTRSIDINGSEDYLHGKSFGASKTDLIFECLSEHESPRAVRDEWNCEQRQRSAPCDRHTFTDDVGAVTNEDGIARSSIAKPETSVEQAAAPATSVVHCDKGATTPKKGSMTRIMGFVEVPTSQPKPKSQDLDSGGISSDIPHNRRPVNANVPEATSEDMTGCKKIDHLDHERMERQMEKLRIGGAEKETCGEIISEQVRTPTLPAWKLRENAKERRHKSDSTTRTTKEVYIRPTKSEEVSRFRIW